MRFALLGFLAFLFYRIGTTIAFDRPATLWFCAIVAIIVTLVSFAVGLLFSPKVYLYTARMQATELAERVRARDEMFVDLAKYVGVGSLLTILAAWLVAIGFSPEFYKWEISYAAGLGRGSIEFGPIVAFAAIVAAPIIIFYAIQIANIFAISSAGKS